MGLFHTDTANAAEQAFKATSTHQALAQESEWLNTERPLVADDLAGRIILLDFWTFCCINCMHVIPDLQYLEEKFGDTLTVIGVHSAKFTHEKDSENIRAAVLRYGIEHPVVNDADFRIWRAFGARSWPTFALINPRGQVERMLSGEGHREDLEDAISDLIKKYDGKFNAAPLPIALEKDKQPPSVLHYPGKLTYAENVDGAPALFISDSSHYRILGIRLDGHIFLEIGNGKKGYKDGSFAEAEFNLPQGLLYKDNQLIIADTYNHTVRKADLSSGRVTTIAGTGQQGYNRHAHEDDALKTELASPWDLAFYPDEDHIAIAMAGTHQLWSYDIKEERVSVLAGNGRESIDDGGYPFNSLSQPSDLSVQGDKLYFVDSETSALRVLEAKNIETLIGTGLFDFGFKDGTQGTALLQHPLGLFADQSGVYIADSYNHSIRKYDYDTRAISTISGNGERGEMDGALAEAQYNEPNDILKVGNKFYIADTNNNRIRVMDMAAGTVTTLEVLPKEKPVEISEDLPNVAADNPPSLMPGKEISVGVRLPEGWKLNAEAPSWLALFEEGVFKTMMDKAALEGGAAALPALEEGKPYRLQGIFYYCEDKPDALCLIRSYDQSFTAEADNSGSAITIPLVP